MFKLLLKRHKATGGRHQNECHGKYLKIFKILERDSLGFVQVYWDESFTEIAKDTFVLELNTEPEPHQLEEILSLKNVELFEEPTEEPTKTETENEMNEQAKEPVERYTRKQLESLHSITLNVIYKKTFPDGNYFANNHLNVLTDEDLIKAILSSYKKAPEKKRELKASTRRAYGLRQLVKHLELYMDDHCSIDPYRFSNLTHNSVYVHEFDGSQWGYIFTGRYDKSDINDLIDSVYRAVRRSNEAAKSDAV